MNKQTVDTQEFKCNFKGTDGKCYHDDAPEPCVSECITDDCGVRNDAPIHRAEKENAG